MKPRYPERALLVHGDSLSEIPKFTVDLVFTSPPYNVGIDYETHDDNMSPTSWYNLVKDVLRRSWWQLKPGGRMVVNVIPLAGRKPPILTGYYTQKIMDDLNGSYWMGKVIWDKASGTGSSTAWGTWRSPRAPVFRGEYEELFVIGKGSPRRDDIPSGESDISAEEFNLATREVWRDIGTASAWADDYPHPVPFPPALAQRVIRLLTAPGDIVLDPFSGRGTTVMVAESLGRRGIGVEIGADYIETSSRLLTDNLIDHEVVHGGLGCGCPV